MTTRGSLAAEPEPVTSFDLRDHAEAEAFANGHYPRPHGPWCDQCGYRLDSPGHRNQCETP